jgi:2-polyprenyl-3-methyl-5-hydroxy-6-metoxy-1,4-benzoquinol methylase
MDETEKHTASGKAHYNEWDIDLRETRYKKIEKIILSLKPGKLLDVGCSSGKFSCRFIKKGFQVYGIDYAEKRVNEAKHKGLNAVVGDITKKLPFADGFFDIVLAGELIEHVIDTDGLIAEFNRVLKPRGVLIVTTPNLASFENRLRLLLGIYPAWTNYSVEPPNHIRSYTLPVLIKQLKQNGFKNIKATGNFVPFIPQVLIDDIKFPLLGATGSIFPSLSQGLIVSATKEHDCRS